MPDQVEQQLFEKAREGKRSAFQRLQEHLEGPIRRFIRRLVGQSASEDDIVQDAFLSLYMNLSRIDPVENLRPFLFRIVRNLCYDELRRKGRFLIVSLDEIPGDAETARPCPMDHRPPPDEEVYWILLYSEVQEAMDRLPEMQRQSLILYCEEDLSYAQIAEATATDIGTVKSRIYYARRNLAKLLRPEILQTLGLNKEVKQGGNRRCDPSL